MKVVIVVLLGILLSAMIGVYSDLGSCQWVHIEHFGAKIPSSTFKAPGQLGLAI
jgi:hypothetical protein